MGIDSTWSHLFRNIIQYPGSVSSENAFVRWKCQLLASEFFKIEKQSYKYVPQRVLLNECSPAMLFGKISESLI